MLLYIMLSPSSQLSLGIEWEEDDDFPFQPPPIGDHCLACSTVDWLTDHGIEGVIVMTVLSGTVRGLGVGYVFAVQEWNTFFCTNFLI